MLFAVRTPLANPASASEGIYIIASCNFGKGGHNGKMFKVRLYPTNEIFKPSARHWR